METMKSLFIILGHLSIIIANSDKYNSLQIKNLKLTKCHDKDYSVTVNNVILHLATKPKIQISGSLNSQLDLIGPVKADVWVYRHFLGAWIPVPCEDKIGSCTYDNLCDYGIPKNETCPEEFLKNGVPCRCPIKKGNYTIAPTLDLEFDNPSSILSGTYKGTVEITQNKSLLSCYNFYFVLYDEYELYSVVLI